MKKPTPTLALEREVSRRTQKENPDEVLVCEKFLNHLGEGFNRMQRPVPWEEREGTVLLLLALGLNSLRWSFEMLLKGYYFQSVTLSRAAWESWLSASYLRLYEDVPVDEWRNYDQRPKPWLMRELVAKKSAELGGIDAKEYEEGLDRIYKDFSELSHPSNLSTAILTTMKEGGDWYLRVGPDYDGDLVLLSTDFFGSSAGSLASMFYSMTPGDSEYLSAGHSLGENFSEWRSKMKKSGENG